MKAQTLTRDICARLGAHLEYPDENAQERLLFPRGPIEAVSPRAAVYMKEFSDLMSTMEPWMCQEHYVQTFDVMPQCSLYLSIHLFGEESFNRAELMAGLKGVYERHHAFEMTELPDHLGVVLKQNALFEDDEWAELVSMCLLPAIPKMIGELEKRGNSYALILKAVQALLEEADNGHV